MAAKWKTSIRKDGPFFRRDPEKTFRGNAHEMMKAVARVGAEDVRGQMRVGEANRAPIRALGDRVSDHVGGELRRYPAGSPYSAVVFVVNRGFSRDDAISMMAAASRVESQTHAFRKTAGRISRSRAVNVEQLLKGLT